MKSHIHRHTSSWFTTYLFKNNPNNFMKSSSYVCSLHSQCFLNSLQKEEFHQRKSYFTKFLTFAFVGGTSAFLFHAHAEEKKKKKLDKVKKIKRVLSGSDKILAKTNNGQVSFDEFRPYKLINIKKESNDTKIFRFALPNPFLPLGLIPPSCLVAQVPHDYSIPIKKRPYSPISSNKDLGFFDIIVKVYEDGKMSQYIHNLKQGDVLEFRAREPKFIYQPNKNRQYITMIGGGTGIAPLFQLIQEILNNPQDHSCISLIYSNKSVNDILLKKELDDLVKQYPHRLKIYYTLTRDYPTNWKYGKGRISLQTLQENIPPASENNDNNLVIVCGSGSFLRHVCGARREEEVGGLLAQLSFTKHNVIKL